MNAHGHVETNFDLLSTLPPGFQCGQSVLSQSMLALRCCFPESWRSAPFGQLEQLGMSQNMENMPVVNIDILVCINDG